MNATDRLTTADVPASLPDLTPGVTLLSTESTNDHPIQTLAVDHILRAGGDAHWVDPGTHARTRPLVEVAPAPRILDRISVARGFTPFQHLELLRSLPEMLTGRTELLVVPDLDRYYRDESLLGDEGQEMLLSALASLTGAARNAGVPALVTRSSTDSFSEPIETAATQRIACEQTPFGPRFRADGEETLVYPEADGQWVQTTLAFWQRILAARQPLYESLPENAAVEQGVTVHGTN